MGLIKRCKTLPLPLFPILILMKLFLKGYGQYYFLFPLLYQGIIILLLPPPQGGGKRNQKSEIREENSKLIRKRRDKKGGEEKNGKKKGGKGRKKEKIKERNRENKLKLVKKSS